jgi:glycosyltransferase involved in cell wall biosynthesis
VSSTTPRVTVGIPFHDEEERLPFAIRSVLAQTWSNLEVLLVDDGSTDRSLEIARSVRDERVRLISDGRRRFLPARLNQIVAEAKGELVARMDADDVIHPDRIKKQVEALNESGCVASGTWAAIVDDSLSPLVILESASPPTARAALERGLMVHPSLMARRDWFTMHPYDETLTRAEDRDLWCRTVSTRFAIVEEPLYLLRVSPRRDARFLNDYRESQRQNRMLYARYGVPTVGRLRTMRRVCESYAKEWIMSGAVALGIADRIVRRRGRPPTETDRHLVIEALEASGLLGG